MPSFTPAIPRILAEKLGEFRSILDFGALADAVVLTDAAMTSGTDLLNSASAGFTADVVGKWFVVVGADGSTSDPLVGTCLARVSATRVQLSVSATATVSAAKCVYGTDNQAAIDAAYENCLVRGEGSLLVPAGRYLYRGGLTAQSHVHLHGRGASSILYSASFADGQPSALIANNLTGCGFFDLAFECDANERKNNEENARLLIRGCTDVAFDNIHVDGSNTVGIFITNSQRVRGGEVFIQNTMADGLHTTNGSKNVRVNSINGYNTGDDTAAIVSYAGDPAGQVEDVVYEFVKSVGSRGRGFGIVGPKNCQVRGYQIEDPLSHGFVIAYEPAFSTFVPSWIKVGPGKIKGANSSPSYNGFFIGGTAGNIPEHIEVVGATLEDCNQAQVTYAKRVRIERMEKTAGEYRGLLVINCEQVDTVDCTFRDIDDEAVTYDTVTRGRIDNCTAYECQIVGNGSRARFSVLECRQITGKNNYDFRETATGATLGALLVSNTVNAYFISNLIEVNGHAPGAATGSKVFGMYYDSAREILRLDNDFEPVADTSYGVVSRKGMYILDGPIQIDGSHSFRGSGGAAELSLASGFPRLSGDGGMEIEFDRTGANPSASLAIKRDGVVLMTIASNGDAFLQGKIFLGNLSTSWISGGSGSPEGTRTAAPGSQYLDVSGAADRMLWIKTSGTGNTGWSYIPVNPELPGDGSAGNVLHLTGTGPRTLSFKKVALGDSTSVNITGGDNVPIKRAVGGGLWADRIDLGDSTEVNCPGGLGDVLVNDGSDAVSFLSQASLAGAIAVELDLYALLDDLQTQIDSKASTTHGHTGSTDSAGSPAHSHGISL